MARRSRTLSARVFEWLLALFPGDFRGDFGDDMRADFQDQQRDVSGASARVQLWLRTAAGITRQAGVEHGRLLWRDLTYALRLLRRQPGFAAVAVLTLALGIGTNTAIFSLADGMLFRPLPYRDPGRLVLVQGFSRATGQPYTAVRRVDVEQLRVAGRAIDDIGFVGNSAGFTLPGSGGAERIPASEASGNLLDLLGVVPHLGRLLRTEDGVALPRPAMLTFAAWQSRFGADAAIVGRTVRFDEATVDIVGVLPQDFIYPTQGFLASGELLLVEPPNPAEAADPRAIVFSPVARLAPGVTVEQAQREADLIVRRAADAFPDSRQQRDLRVSNLQYALFELSRSLLWLLVGAALFVLLIACLNLAALMTARGAAREKEMGIRQSIGASRARLVRQLFVESIVVSIVGGGVALLAAYLTFDALRQYVPPSYRLVPDGLDARALVFAGVLSLAAGLACGVFPAIRLSRPDLESALRERGRMRAPAAGVMRAGAPLVAAEVTLALVLFTGAGLMVNSLVRMRTVDLGFEPKDASAVSIALPMPQYAAPVSRYDYVQDVLERVRRVPGVEAAAAVEYLQVADVLPPVGLREGAPPDTGVWRVTPGYFAAMGIPLLQGRDLSAGDVVAGDAIAVVDEVIAGHYFPGESPLGRRLRVDGDVEATIVGVVKAIRGGYGRPISPAVYRPMTPQRPGTTIVARTTGDSAALAAVMRTEAQRLEPRATVWAPASVAAILRGGIGRTQFETSLFVLFGVLGLVVAAIGVYGLMASWVGARVREMGVRMALGANGTHLQALVVRQAAAPLAVGVACGLAGSFAFGRPIETMLYGITPHDPATLLAAAALLLGVGLLAAYLPARRASRVDPLVVLRAE